MWRVSMCCLEYILCGISCTSHMVKYVRAAMFLQFKTHLRVYHTQQGDNSLKSVERFDHMMFVCRFQAYR